MKNCVEKIFGGLRGSYFSYALTYFSFYFGMGAFISVQSVYLMGLGKSTGEMSFIVSASSLFGIVLIPAVGYLNDRLKKPRLIAGLLLAAVAVLGAVFAASRSTWVLYVLNGLIMGLVSAISPVCERMAGSGRFRYGTVRVWGTIGYAAAAQLAGLVMEFIAPRMIFVLFGAAIAVAAAGFAGTDGIRFEQEAEKSTAADQLSFLSKPMFLLFAAIALVFSGMSNLNITYSPILLQELGLSTGFVGTALSLSTLVELPVILFSNRFMDRFSGRALTAAGFAVMLLQFLLYGFSSSAWLAFLSMLLLKAVGSTLFMMIMLKV
ncbi:MAG: MFS transporter [Acutalibacteraceae bacterium]